MHTMKTNVERSHYVAIATASLTKEPSEATFSMNLVGGLKN